MLVRYYNACINLISFYSALYMLLNFSHLCNFRVPGMEKSFDPITRTGNFTYYFSHNASCSEVEIDCLTGEHQVNHSNINCKLFETGWLGGQDNVSELPLNCFFYYSKTYFFRFCQFVFSKIRFLTSSVTLQLLFFILRFSLF